MTGIAVNRLPLPIYSTTFIVTVKPHPDKLHDTSSTDNLVKLGGFLCFSKQPKQAEFRTEVSLPTRLPPEGETMASGPPAEGLRYQADSTLRPRRLSSGPGHRCTKAATPRGPARLARRAPPQAPACGLARDRGRKGRAQPLQAAAPAARGAPLAPRTYLWRPRPARAARSPTTAGRPSPPRHRRNPRRPSLALGS